MARLDSNQGRTDYEIPNGVSAGFGRSGRDIDGGDGVDVVRQAQA
jgi:hypothetical protein